MAARDRWDIFCRVVDNYGDVAVAWRLARCLAREQHKRVRLYLDDLTVLAKLRPGADARAEAQKLEGVDVRHWHEGFAEREFAPVDGVADVVVETFGCETPEAYVLEMAARDPLPCWINLEYLSAEDWVEGSHALPSPHPRLAPLTRHFFFPGFTARTGGLLRERGLLARRDAFQADRQAQAAFWHGLAGREPAPGALRVSLFGYAVASYQALFEALAHNATPVWLVVPEGVAATALASWLGGKRAGTRGSLEAIAVPFVEQNSYDELLWACDLNFVRGEDSFVRAQWAARPFVWLAYPQDDDAHWVKLRAFMALYTGGMDRAHAGAFTAMWEAWNRAEAVGLAWPAFAARLPAFAAQAGSWALAQAARDDLAARLADFADNVLK